MSFGLLFWILMLFWLVGMLWTNYPYAFHFWPNVLLFVLIGLLGWKIFGAPVHG